MNQRRNSDGFNLAFLDVMACGLGAIILILMLVKFNHSQSPASNAQNIQEDLQAQINRLQENIEKEKTVAQQKQQQSQKLTIEYNASQQRLNNQKVILKNIEATIDALPQQADSHLSLQGASEENYLLGLTMQGKHIGILLDTSASMTEVALIDIIRRKVGNNIDKKIGPKWQRALRTLQWLLARAPAEAKITLVSFNDKARVIGSQKIIAASDREVLQDAINAAQKLIPQNGTNLHLALETLHKNNSSITDLYIITDGLPTLFTKESNPFKTFSQCTSLLGAKKTISGECRLQLFYASIQHAHLRNITINTILLPLEGDPQAPQAYWDWTASTGGLMLSPAESWP